MQCEMSNDCKAPVTHIGSNGYIYCQAHAIIRRELRYERTRKMTPKEIRTIEEGHALTSY